MTHTLTTSNHLDRRTRRPVARLLLHPVLHLVLALGAGLGLAGAGTDTMAPVASAAPVSATPATVGDGTADHDLFNPSATLSMSTIDDLRDAPEGPCFADGGVLTPAGDCMAGVVIYPEEVDVEVWNRLTELGYDRAVGMGTNLLIPQAMVTLDGDGDEIAAVDPTAPLA